MKLIPIWLPKSYLKWILIGLLLVGLHIILAWQSHNFDYNQELVSKPILIVVGIETLAGAAYLLAIWRIGEVPSEKVLLVWILIIGFLLRACLMISVPILEDDYYRYLWDGAVTANKVNPYAYAPKQIIEGDINKFPPILSQLANDSENIIFRINHSQVRTIYPPVAQVVFASAYWLHPWSILTWRIVLLLFDIATLMLLIIILRVLQISPLYLAIYWWNPIVLKEIFNSGHMDVIILPCILGSLLLAMHSRYIWSVILLGLAVGVKLWPILLVPIVLWPIISDLKKCFLAVCTFVLLVSVMFLPIYAAGLNSSSGFIAYGQKWEMNDALFMLIQWGTAQFLKAINFQTGYEYLITRLIVSTLLFFFIVWIIHRKSHGMAGMVEQSLLITSAIFLLSPTQFPWYYIWLVPLLAIRPSMPLLLLTMLLPLYYLRFYVKAYDEVEIFDYGIVWLEYMPVWYLLILNRYRHHLNILF